MNKSDNKWRTLIVDRLRDRNRSESSNFNELIQCSK